MVLVVKDPPANAGDIRDASSIPGSGRSPGGGHDNLLQYSCLENPMDRRAWWAIVHWVAKPNEYFIAQFSNLIFTYYYIHWTIWSENEEKRQNYLREMI